MAKMKGGQKWLYERLKYPDRARKAGLEGRVRVQFIVTGKGDVEDARFIRGIGGG
ncbi:TonB family protein [Fodinibius sediminis]|uniref:TonB family C-terminal domain-containing protein n=1 Tax=Fodinibius sediminis TaxID=1214077 RepID=A0A521DIR5_9BACT|nr:TonB family protein [Fodinibius sediminis]SMO71508.1 TonB family C-terminal domain-containing protein [Fodinibius sediminis]